ncbi:MAG: tyrosine-type recombinase/integrase [Acidobacteria bacterium]|nr:tyrosine-type recombinase/integrase [Acidobacteriota bacterium]
MYNPAHMLLYRRHLRTCRHRKKGQNFAGCQCPIWIDGILNGKRYRKALETCEWEKAERKKAGLESFGEDRTSKTVAEAIAAWDSYLVSQKLRESTLTKYRRLLAQFSEWCAAEGYVALRQVTVEELDAFRAFRPKIAATTSVKELQTFRGFFAFCRDRKWCDENPAKRIKTPKVPDNKIVPYTREEVSAIMAGCDEIGQQPYERVRARAMLLVMRHTGLRISDVLFLRKDQVRDGVVQLFTKKTGGHVLLPVPRELRDALDALPLPHGAKRETGYFFWNGHSKPKAILNNSERLLLSVFNKSGVRDAHAHRFRHTLATDLLGRGASEQDVADVLGISPTIVRKHYGKWSQARQNRIFELMRQYQEETIACPFCNGEGRTKAGECGQCEGAGRIHIEEKTPR